MLIIRDNNDIKLFLMRNILKHFLLILFSNLLLKIGKLLNLLGLRINIFISVQFYLSEFIHGAVGCLFSRRYIWRFFKSGTVQLRSCMLIILSVCLLYVLTFNVRYFSWSAYLELIQFTLEYSLLWLSFLWWAERLSYFRWH